MRTLHKNEDGSASHWTMTRREFRALSTDRRNTPGRTDVPLCMALDPLTGATVLVQVIYACEHGTPDKTRCQECEEVAS